MDKYAGMNKVETKIVKNDQVRSPKKEVGVGYGKIFFMQAVIVVLLGCALLVGKVFSFKKYDTVTSTVKEAVCFDMTDYVSDLLRKATE